MTAGPILESAETDGGAPTAGGRRSFLGPLALLLGVLGPVAGAIAVVTLVPDSLHTVMPRPSTVTMPVTLTRDDQSQAVQAALSWHSGPSLTAPNWSGLVTAVGVAVGERITSGTAIVTIDGIERIALASARPFYRPIGPGVTGGDVQDLRRALSGLGFGPLGTGDTYDSALKSAIRRLEAQLTGGSATQLSGVFDPSWVVFLPAAAATVGSVAMQVGSAAPPPGQAIVTSRQILTPFNLSATPSQGVSEPLPSSAFGYVLVLGNGAVIRLAHGFTVSNYADLARVASAVGIGTSSLTGVIRLAAPEERSTVPSTSVVSDASGKYCVFVVDGGGLKPFVVRPTGGLPGVTEVIGLPASVQRVVTNPQQVAPDRSC
jgi:hypothetical protein